MSSLMFSVLDPSFCLIRLVDNLMLEAGVWIAPKEFGCIGPMELQESMEPTIGRKTSRNSNFKLVMFLLTCQNGARTHHRSVQRQRWYPTALVLANGSILVMGGEQGSNGFPEASLEILPPIAGGPKFIGVGVGVQN